MSRTDNAVAIGQVLADADRPLSVSAIVKRAATDHRTPMSRNQARRLLTQGEGYGIFRRQWPLERSGAHGWEFTEDGRERFERETA